MYFDELKVGMTKTLNNVHINKEEMIAFAKDYDNVPIHVDEEYASHSNFKQLLAPGMYPFLLMWAEYLKDDFYGEELLAGNSTKVEWLAPVFAGDVLNGTAKIVELKERNSKNGLVTLEIDIWNQNNIKVINSRIEAIVKKKI